MPTLSRSEAEDILYQEARLLDDRRYADWIAMLTEDAIYWIPTNGDGGDPKRTISLVYDDMTRLRDRLARLNSGIAHAQSPPSMTKRLISNVQIESGANYEHSRAVLQNSAQNVVEVFSAFIMCELRRGKERVFAGRYEHRMRLERGTWKITAKKVVLINNDEVIDNLTFIV